MFVCDLISSRVGIKPPSRPSEYSFQLGRIYSGTSPHEDWFPICDFLQCTAKIAAEGKRNGSTAVKSYIKDLTSVRLLS